MNPRVAQFANLYNLDTTMVQKALEDVKPADLHKRVNNSGSTLHWIFGHIVASRHDIAKIIEADTDWKHYELFSGSGQQVKESSAYPPIEELQKTFDSVTNKLMKRLGELNDNDIDKKLKDKWPHGDDTNLGAISFMAWHEGWHIGQMSVLRKHLGYKGLAG